jgi:GPH family glycoside/pentoside/hexuronide:cation symporter
MSDQQHFETAPEDKISLSKKLIYGLGAFVNNILAAAMGGMVIVLNLGLGMNPALVGLVSALPRLTDAITDPLMGYISDHTKSKWGRRRPYIFFGAITASILFALLWQFPRGYSEEFYFWFFLIGSIIFLLGHTLFATPWVALGYELTPDYHERTRLMAVQNAMGYVAYLVAPWFVWFMQLDSFDDIIEGAGWLAIIIAAFTLTVGVLPALLLKERFVVPPASQPMPDSISDPNDKSIRGAIKGFFKGFLITLKFKPFLYLCVATFLVFNGFQLVASFQIYVIIYYVFAGDQAMGAEYFGWAGTMMAGTTFAVIFFVSWLATKIGKKRAFYYATAVSMVGYSLKWFFYNPDYPWLVLVPAPFMAFGLGALFTLMGSMIADVCDMDELNTHERREGMYGSIFWWVVKLGMAVALAGGGILLNYTGFDVKLGGAQSEETIYLMRIFDAFIPTLCSGLAIWMVYKYPITEQKAHEIREELEKRRQVA